MSAEYFFITLYDETQNLLRFPYFKDAEDEPFVGGIQPGKSLTAYVLRTGKSLLCTQAVHDELERQGEVKLLGVPSAIWLGVPLVVEGKTIGAMVVQHYSDPKAFGEREQHMLEFVSTQVAVAINRKRIEEKVEEERILLRTLIDNLPDRVYVMDVQGRKIISNIADWQASGGKAMEDVIGKTDLDTYPPELAEDYWALDKTVIDSGISVINREEPGLDSHGNRVWVLSSKVPLCDGQGKVVGLVGVGRDITERKQAEEEIRQLNAELEQRVEERTHELREAQEQLVRKEKLAVLGQLAGGVGHELRNPLGVINTAIYYLKLVQPDAGEKIKLHHAIIVQEVHNAEKIIADLLDYARVISSDREPASVPDLVRGVLGRFPVPPSVQVALKLPADLPMVYADPRQMEQVLGNLTVNACQAMASTSSATGVPQGGKLTISARKKKGMVAIAVKDTGTGISPENMKKLFEPLFTTKVKGIGLGLAVSRKLAEANGGWIEVKSEPGKGSTFTLVLPVDDG
jgi:PAS domain S-box-containing protein